MHDIRAIRANAAAFDAALARRGLPSASADILARDAERRAPRKPRLQEKQARRNALSREIGQGKRDRRRHRRAGSRGDRVARRDGGAGKAGRRRR